MNTMILTDELLLNYKRCRRRTYLDVHGNPQQRDPEKEFLLKLRRESQTHINNVLLARSFVYQKPLGSWRNWSLNARQTKIMMQQGVDCIYGGVLALNFTDWQLSTKLVNSDPSGSGGQHSEETSKLRLGITRKPRYSSRSELCPHHSMKSPTGFRAVRSLYCNSLFGIVHPYSERKI